MNEAKIKREIYTVKNRRMSVQQKMLLKFASIFVAAFIFGLIGYYVLQIPFADKLNECIIAHFTISFDFTETLSRNCTLIFTTSYSDIKTLVLIFIAGFTMFSSIAIYWLLFSRALSLGFSSIYLVNAMSNGKLDAVSFFDLVFFLFASAAISSMIILYSSKTRFFNDHFRTLGNRKKLIIRSKPLYDQIFTLLSLIGAIILINSVRFILNTI